MNVPILGTFLILVIIFQVVQTQKYLFQTAKISYKSINQKPVKRRQFRALKSLDQHIFASAVDLKVETSRLQLIEGAVKSLPHLKALRLKNCGVEILAPGAFRNLPQIELVHLQDNGLRIIENGVFNFLPVRELWLHRNRIRTIRSGAFDDMPNLEVIKLNNNSISLWDSNWFLNTPKLSQVFFRKNRIKDLPARAFSNLKSSHKVNGEELVDLKLYLSHNRIRMIHPQAFDGLDALDELSLNRNLIEKIDESFFSHFTELNKLGLAWNEITEIDEDAFKNLKEILELDLSGNFLECLPYKVVAITRNINVTGIFEMECECLGNLREKITDNNLPNKIFRKDRKCDSD